MAIKAEHHLDERPNDGKCNVSLFIHVPKDRSDLLRFIASMRNEPLSSLVRSIIENYFTPGTLPPIEKAILETRPSGATRKAQYYRDRYQKQKAARSKS